MSKLTPKQERFVQEYLIDLNATQAAIRAGYSEDTARQQGSRLLTNDDIAERVAEYQKEQKEKFSISYEEKQRLLLKIAEYGLIEREVGKDSGDVKQINPTASVAAIKELNLMDGDHAAQKIQTEDVTPPSVEYIIPDENSSDQAAG